MAKGKDNPIRVLLVEDNPGDARLVEIMLTELQDGAFKVAKAERFSAATDILGTDEIDVILLDLGLPDSAGLETASRMVEAAPRHPIVVLTGLDDEKTGMEAVRLGVQDYLVKGQIEGPVVRRAVRYAMDRHAAFQVLRHQLTFQQQMVDALPSPVFYTDATLTILGCNHAFLDKTGLARHDVLGGPVYEVLPEGLSAVFDERDLGRVGEARTTPVTFGTPAGKGRQGTITVTPFADMDGVLAGLVVCLGDIA